MPEYEKIPEWTLGHMGELEPDGYIIVDGGSHSHWFADGRWKYVCGGKECISRAREHSEKKNFILNKNNMSTVKSLIKKITRTEPEKTFVKVGFLDENDEITADGRAALEYVLWNANKEELKKIADGINTDSKD